jgi:hypothetical protein
MRRTANRGLETMQTVKVMMRRTLLCHGDAKPWAADGVVNPQLGTVQACLEWEHADGIQEGETCIHLVDGNPDHCIVEYNYCRPVEFIARSINLETAVPPMILLGLLPRYGTEEAGFYRPED